MAEIIYDLLDEQMTKDELNFYVELGKRVADLRKKDPLTQVQLAAALDISQQLMASYEAGRRKIPVAMIPKLAKIFGVSAEELLGMREKPVKPGPTPKLQRQIEQINSLSRAKKLFVLEMIDAVIQREKSTG